MPSPKLGARHAAARIHHTSIGGAAAPLGPLAAWAQVASRKYRIGVLSFLSREATTKSATSTIPIVFTVGGDPVEIGLVESLNRPGNNTTGVSLLTTTPESKRLGLLHELVPGAKVVGVPIDPNYQEAEAQARELRDAAGTISQRIYNASILHMPKATRNWNPLSKRSFGNGPMSYL
jgi:ABC-type uncharacterized transport system substrate-binding protein